MFNLEQLAKKVSQYETSQDLDAFAEWFRQASWGFYNRAGDQLSDAIFSVRAALSEHEAGELDLQSLRVELATAVRPFAKSDFQIALVSSDRFVGSKQPPMVYRYRSELYDPIRKTSGRASTIAAQQHRLSGVAV